MGPGLNLKKTDGVVGVGPRCRISSGERQGFHRSWDEEFHL